MFSVRLADDDGWLAFTQASAILRAAAAEEVPAIFQRAESALRDGAWIAGYIAYDGNPLVTLGLFEAPHRSNPQPGPFELSPLLPLVSQNDYRRALAEVARRIYDGDVYQVNYTVPFALSLEGDPLAAFSAIAARTGARYQAYVEDGERRILSWSPELFLRFDRERLETRPMKGTAPLHAVERLHDEKNRAEHVMIVDLLRNDLRRVCDDAHVEAFCTVERYASFATMTSSIVGTLRENTTLAQIFSAMFPCGSITGAPKRAAVATIAELESQPRGAYCGSIGYLSPQRRGWWNVAIRTAQLDGQVGRFDAGGGIVSDSDAEDEWREVLLKTAFLTRPFELWETLSSNSSEATVERHLERLAQTAARFDITYDETLIRAQVHATAPGMLVRIRLRNDGSFELLEEPLVSPEHVDVVLSAQRVRSSDPFLRIKSSWRPVHRRGFAEAAARAAFDALLLNERDEVTEGTRSTLFAELDGEFVTPPLECGLLPGILRAQLLERAHVRERVIHARDLERVTALYVGNSARGLLPARLLAPEELS